jgi:hypothetical protein
MASSETKLDKSTPDNAWKELLNAQEVCFLGLEPTNGSTSCMTTHRRIASFTRCPDHHRSCFTNSAAVL